MAGQLRFRLPLSVLRRQCVTARWTAASSVTNGTTRESAMDRRLKVRRDSAVSQTVVPVGPPNPNVSTTMTAQRVTAQRVRWMCGFVPAEVILDVTLGGGRVEETGIEGRRERREEDVCVTRYGS